MNKIIVEITSEALLTTLDILYGLEQHFDKTISSVKEITPDVELQDRLHRRNMLIKTLKESRCDLAPNCEFFKKFNR